MVCTTNFSVVAGHLYKMGLDEIIRSYVDEVERNSILGEALGGDVGGHYAGKGTTQNILCIGLWWPTLHKDSKPYCRACDACQRMGRPLQRDELNLNP